MRHDRITITLHWLIVLLVTVEVATGFIFRNMRFPSPDYDSYHLWHRSIGTTLLILVSVQLWWRSRRPHLPPVPDTRWRLLAAQVAHLALVALLLILPLSKLLRGAFGIGWQFFGLAVAAPFANSRAVGFWTGEVHEIAAWTLLGVVALHALAAFWHHFGQRDATLRRMLPASSRRRSRSGARAKPA